MNEVRAGQHGRAFTSPSTLSEMESKGEGRRAEA